MTVHISDLHGFVSYYCPNCKTVNQISLESFEGYDIYDVPVRYSNGDTTKAIEFYSPKCTNCEKTFVTFIKREA